MYVHLLLNFTARTGPWCPDSSIASSVGSLVVILLYHNALLEFNGRVKIHFGLNNKGH